MLLLGEGMSDFLLAFLADIGDERHGVWSSGGYLVLKIRCMR